jgi:DNA-directed RNA polymerase specialized sigma24 family protein
MDDSGEPRIPQRHVAELSAFFAAHDRWLFGHACVRTRGDRELAADLVQDTFEAAARGLGDAARACRGPATRLAARHAGAIALQRAREIIGEMPPRQQEIALMRWQDRMKATEIAAVLGVAEGTVHAHLHTARGKLVAGLERYYPLGRDDGKGAAS